MEVGQTVTILVGGYQGWQGVISAINGRVVTVYVNGIYVDYYDTEVE